MTDCGIFGSNHFNVIAEEFDRLNDRCYLDSAGAGLYAKSQIEACNNDLLQNVYMNPHTDKTTSDCVDQVRYTILRHYNANPKEYSVVFTSGATSALKILGESFKFKTSSSKLENGVFVYLTDSHTSAVGLREFAYRQNVDVIPVGHNELFRALKNDDYQEHIDREIDSHGNGLFIYPAQSNFNGFKYPLLWIEKVSNGELNNLTVKINNKLYEEWYTCLDTASYVSTNKLDLARTKPDFLCLSFYKIFGFPTGLGALIIKNSSSHILSEKAYFGGGSVDLVLNDVNFHIKRPSIHERFEDGTISFLSILAIKHGFDTLNRLIPKVIKNDTMESISQYTFDLAQNLYKNLKSVTHWNGRPVAIIYADTDYTDRWSQGPIVTFNLLRSDGRYIGYSEVSHMASLYQISLRVGCFCSTGSCQRMLGISTKELKDMFMAGHVCGDDKDLIDGKPTGCVRVSFGYYNTLKDVDKLLKMIKDCFVETEKNPISRLDNCERCDDIFYFQNNSPTHHEAILKKIVLYPIKSCGAYIADKDWIIGDKGLDLDRKWMIIKENGVCLTQKHCTAMCMIKPSFDLRKKVLILNFKNMPSLALLININNNITTDASLCLSKVCGDKISGIDCGENASQWISEALEISGLRLIQQSDEDERTQKGNSDKDNQNLLSLSNQAQFLLVNLASVRWLASKVDGDFGFRDHLTNLVDRFRANLIVDTGKEFTENSWESLTILGHKFKVDGFCTRCQMICIDQSSGHKTIEPLRTISEQFSGKMRFGIYLSYIGTGNTEKSVKLKNDAKIIAKVQHNTCT